MKTTVQVDLNTLELLKKAKETMYLHSYDETIRRLILKTMKKESLFGYLGKKKGAEVLRGLRDKSDRF